jgi:hypothetical protein
MTPRAAHLRETDCVAGHVANAVRWVRSVKEECLFFIGPDDLKLISHRLAVAALARGTRWI